MPEISRFYGIVIKMFFKPKEHEPSHIYGLFEQVQLDESRTCVFWDDYIDLPSDAIYENLK